MPQGWTFQPNPPMAKDTSGLWEIPSGERQVEGILSSGGFKLWVSLRVLRAAIHFQAPRGSGRVVWQEDALDELPVSIEGPSNVRCQILLEGDNETVLLSELGELNKSGVMRTTLRHFRDSLALSPLAAAEFHIQVGNHPSIPARHYFASAARISQCLPTEELNAVLFRLPDIGPALARAKELVDNPQVVFDSPSEFDVPDSLATLLCGLAYGAAKFDNAHLVDDVEAYKKHSPQFMCSVVDWLSKTEALVYSLGSEQELLKQFPEDAVSLVPVHRWQQALRDKKKWIQHNHDLPRLIREWRIAITCTDRDKDSELFNRNLGPQLTNAVRTYNDSFAAVGKATNQILTRAIIDLARIADSPSADVIVKLFVPPFLQLACYRSGRMRDAAQVRIPDFPPVLAQVGTAMHALATKCKGEVNLSGLIEGEGFALLSIREEDALLDSEINGVPSTGKTPRDGPFQCDIDNQTVK
jgi:hypothetical protein